MTHFDSEKSEAQRVRDFLKAERLPRPEERWRLKSDPFTLVDIRRVETRYDSRGWVTGYVFMEMPWSDVDAGVGLREFLKLYGPLPVKRG